MALVKTETQALGNHQHSSRFGSLYVGDLSPDVTEKDLIDKFSLNVPVVSVHLCRNSVTGKSMCYAYINFDSPFSGKQDFRLFYSFLRFQSPILVSTFTVFDFGLFQFLLKPWKFRCFSLRLSCD